MATWRNCVMETFFHNGSSDVSPCEVGIDKKSIVVSYREDGRSLAVIYRGKENDTGHYKLSGENVHAEATLHRSNDEDFLEGWWREEGDEGMWRIELIE